jgi:hypothetical protein
MHLINLEKIIKLISNFGNGFINNMVFKPSLILSLNFTQKFTILKQKIQLKKEYLTGYLKKINVNSDKILKSQKNWAKTS